MSSSNKTYFPNLDATRFFAFIPVFFTHVFFSQNPKVLNSFTYHFVETHLKVGILGLDYFFVLSSFLITWIILEEYQNHGTVNLKNFFARRSLRIWPLYFFIVAIGFGAASYFTTAPLPGLPYFLFFVLNFYIVQHGDAFLFFLVSMRVSLNDSQHGPSHLVVQHQAVSCLALSQNVKRLVDLGGCHRLRLCYNAVIRCELQHATEMRSPTGTAGRTRR